MEKGGEAGIVAVGVEGRVGLVEEVEPLLDRFVQALEERVCLAEPGVQVDAEGEIKEWSST